jgi:hypothetical protein
MRATLAGQKFDITAISPSQQAISSKEPTEWQWEVTADDTGTYPLYLTLTAVIDINGVQSPRQIESFERTIDVRVVPVTLTRKVLDFAGRNWQWLWTAILIPVVGLLFRRRKTRPAPTPKT